MSQNMRGGRQLVVTTTISVALISVLLPLVGPTLGKAVDLEGNNRQKLVAELQGAGVKFVSNKHNGKTRFLGADRYSIIHLPGVAPGAAAPLNAMVIAEKYGALFGTRKPREELELRRESRNAVGGNMVNFQQHYQGVPVMAGELMINMDRGGGLLSMNGEICTVPDNLPVVPSIDQNRAGATALAAVAKWYHLPATDLLATTPVLNVYDDTLIGPGTGEPVRLVWRLEVRARKLAPIRELVLVDAKSGGIALHFNQVDTAKNRSTYSANNTASLPGVLRCTEASGDLCTNGADTEADFAHLYAGATYNFYKTYHNRDSYDNAGAELISSVNFNDGTTCPNAYWNGTQMVYCKGFPEADDVVAHELTHAVTERTSNLNYYYQSGAINESLSDLWGEFVDLTDGYGTDTPAVRWKIGEDLVAPGMTGAIRDMKNPPLYHQPDKMSSSYYYQGAADSGGVHTNSGINNKAVYLLTDGDTFNGQTVLGLGIPKVAAIYYEAQTNLITSGADYLDLDNALNQACANLVGADGITTLDCNQVKAATKAVEMDKQPATDFNPEAEVCSAGKVVNNTFFDNFENGLGKWTLAAASGSQSWGSFLDLVGYPYATSGVGSLFGPDAIVVSDQRATISVAVPAGQPYLHFRHAFDFEYDSSGYYDGGVLEYSSDNGASWNDAMSLFDSGKNYNGTLYSGQGADNPLKGKAAFVGVSHGYVSTRLNLSTLAGQNIKFRWRVGTDTGNANLGWILDDVRVYTCGAGIGTGNTPPVASAGVPQTVAAGAVVTLNGGGSSDSDGSIVGYVWVQTGGTSVILSNAHTATPSFTAPSGPAILTFSLTVTDNGGASASDVTTVTVNPPQPPPPPPPPPPAAGGGGGGCNISPSGEIDPMLFLVFLASLVQIWRRRV